MLEQVRGAVDGSSLGSIRCGPDVFQRPSRIFLAADAVVSFRPLFSTLFHLQAELQSQQVLRISPHTERQYIGHGFHGPSQGEGTRDPSALIVLTGPRPEAYAYWS